MTNEVAPPAGPGEEAKGRYIASTSAPLLYEKRKEAQHVTNCWSNEEKTDRERSSSTTPAGERRRRRRRISWGPPPLLYEKGAPRTSQVKHEQANVAK